MRRAHVQLARSRSLRPNFDLDFANLQTQKVNFMKTLIRRELKCPKQLAFDSVFVLSNLQCTDLQAKLDGSPHVITSNIKNHIFDFAHEPEPEIDDLQLPFFIGAVTKCSKTLAPNSLQMSRVRLPGQRGCSILEEDKMGATVFLLLTWDVGETHVYIETAPSAVMLRGSRVLETGINLCPKRLLVISHGEDEYLEYDFDSGQNAVFMGKPVSYFMLEGGVQDLGHQRTCCLPVLTVLLKDQDDPIVINVGYLRLEM